MSAVARTAALAVLFACVALVAQSRADRTSPQTDTASRAAATSQDREGVLATCRRLLSDWAGLTRYGSDDSELPPPVAGENRVVFIGDDITEEWVRTSSLFAQRKEYVNRGITGQTTAQMLVRFRQDVIALKPKVVVIQGGMNDIAGLCGPGTEGTVGDNVRSMTELAKVNGIRVVLASLTPVCDCGTDQTTLRPQGRIIGLNGALRAYANASGAVFLDYYTPLVNGRDFKRELTVDGLLPNEAGYALMSRLAEHAISEALVK
jgi:lysophospholipase L1-like esterase